VTPVFANCFQPIPTIARLSAVSGPLQVGAVLLAPFYHPPLVAEQIATVAAFVDATTIWVFAVGDSARPSLRSPYRNTNGRNARAL
jgi:alkanesulfonate monooxygenase SsuD/methylene tetrahydromethanopterin reductase-like flavin-dependent oxidoreductase (luciferase family)